MHRVFPVLAVLSLFAMACSSDGPSLVTTEAGAPTNPEPASSTTPTPGGPTADVGEPIDEEAADEDAVEAQATDTEDSQTEPAAEAPAPTSTPPDASQPASPATPPAPGAGAGCRAELAGTPVGSLAAQADIDGDSVSDTITTYAIETASGDLEWRLRVETAAGDTLDTPLAVEVGFNGPPVPLGGADVDGDGATHELFTTVGVSASADIVAIHVVEGCDLVQAHENDYPVAFAVGGTVGNLAGLQCVDTDANGVNNSIVAWNGEADFHSDGDWQLFGTEYVLRGAELSQVGSINLEANVSEADFVYGQLTCGAVNY